MPFPNPATQFKPGNPGRPKGRSLTDRLKALLEQTEFNGKPLPGGKGKQIADMIADAIIMRAMQGDHRFVDLIMNRIEGPVVVQDQSEDQGDVKTLRDHLASLKAGGGDQGPGELLGGPARKPPRVRRPRGAP